MVAVADRIERAMSKMTPAELAELDSLLRSEVGFGTWLRETDPVFRWDAPHFLAMQSVLDRVTAGELRRVYFSLPIRHGKTEHNTVRYGACRIELNPQIRVIVTSHKQTKALHFSRKIKRMVRARGIAVSREVNAAGEWETEAGGRVVAIGAGAGSAGENADLIIIDDPIGSRDEAESPAHRDRIWDWLTNDILARSEPHTAVLLTMSRWHQDDPAGRLMDQFGEHWHVLDLPGTAEDDDALGREVGQPLWPELRNAAWHDEKRRELLDYGYASLIQGRPRPREGGMFKWSWWQLGGTVPATGPLVRYWDLAGTKPRGAGHDPDFTSGTLGGRTPEKQTVIAHIDRFRCEVAARDAKIEARARQDLKDYGRRVIYWIEKQAGISGTEATEALVRRVQSLGIACYAEAVTGSKAERATPLASAAMSGNVLLAADDPDAPWHNAFRTEAADFPTGTHDDSIDSTSGMFNKLESAGHLGVTTFKNPF